MIAPDEHVFVTIRTIARFYLLRPDSELVEAIKYCLAHYASIHSIKLHAVCTMSTHIHMVLYDAHCNRSLFLRDSNRAIANVVKALRDWRGPVFRPKPNIVRLLTQEALADKIGYTLANPIAAGAVRNVSDWPGICAAASSPGYRASTVRRPNLFFSAKSRLPERIRFELDLPSSLTSIHGTAKTRYILEEARKRHTRRANRSFRPRNFQGVRRCLEVSPYERATTFEPVVSREPSFAVLGGGQKAFVLASKQLKEFRRRYRDARRRWMSGLRETTFPLGTWLMRIVHGVKCQTSDAFPLRALWLWGEKALVGQPAQRSSAA